MGENNISMIEYRKKAGVDFLQLVTAGKIDEAYEKYIDLSGKHHNPFTPAGFPALQKGMKEADSKFPHKQYTVLHVLGDADRVAVHARLVLVPGETTLSVVHMMRFQGEKIVEFWDFVQPLTPDSPNQDGLF
jgi:predicted SnoaL-like aldol condensation-catalyzing enzyme